MNKTTLINLLTGLILTLPLIQACGGGEVSSETTSSPGKLIPLSKVSLTPAFGEVTSGDTFVRTVTIEKAAPTFFTAFDLTYDPSVVEFVGAGEGTFLNRNGTEQTSFQAALQNGNPGRLTVGLTRLGQVGDVSGDGNLVTLTFHALKPGTTVLAFSGPRGLKDSQNIDNQMDAWENGVVTVR